MKGLVLLSGGLDSTTCMALAKRECGEVVGLSIVYGQKHSKEIEAAKAVSEFYGAPHKVLEIPRIFEGYGSTLIDADKPNPQLTYEEIRQSEGPSPTYVPQRNLNFLAMASAISLVDKCDYVYFGAHADDAHNFAYPDCTPEFIGAAGSAVFIGSYYQTRLRSPLTWLTKAGVVKLATELGAPVHLTWSCYEGGSVHCGVCPTCISRKEAFIQAEVQDPTIYAAEKLKV